MAERRPVIQINISVGATESPEEEKREAAPAEPTAPAGLSAIRHRLLKAGERPTYAREHAARIWNNAHPEAPAPTSFDQWEEDGTWPEDTAPKNAPTVTPLKKRKVYSSGRPAASELRGPRRRKKEK